MQYGIAPYLECSTNGDERFSDYCAYVNGQSIEQQYQNIKTQYRNDFKKINYFYSCLWVQYITENPDFINVIKNCSGFSDSTQSNKDIGPSSILYKIKQNNIHLIGISNRHFYDGDGTYIGRILGSSLSPLANPFKQGKDGNRYNVIKKYQIWSNKQMEINENYKNEIVKLVDLYKQQGYSTLICWCSPKLCHGHVIKKHIINLLKQENY